MSSQALACGGDDSGFVREEIGRVAVDDPQSAQVLVRGTSRQLGELTRELSGGIDGDFYPPRSRSEVLGEARLRMEFAPTGELVRFEKCYVEEEFHTRTVVVLEGPDGSAVARSNEVPFVYSQAVEVELILWRVEAVLQDGFWSLVGGEPGGSDGCISMSGEFVPKTSLYAGVGVGDCLFPDDRVGGLF